MNQHQDCLCRFRYTFNCIEFVALSNQSLRFSKSGKYLSRRTLLLNELENTIGCLPRKSKHTCPPIRTYSSSSPKKNTYSSSNRAREKVLPTGLLDSVLHLVLCSILNRLNHTCLKKEKLNQ